MLTPVEQHAQQRGLPTVIVSDWELLRILEGNPMIVSLDDGSEALMKPMSVVEVSEWQQRRNTLAEGV